MMNSRLKYRAWLCALALGLGVALRASAPSNDDAEARAFTVKTMAELRAQHAGSAFVVAFWSVTCEPCREELKALSALHRQYPKVPIVLVAADPPRDRDAVVRFLRDYALEGIAVRQFADDNIERLRYSVDPAWQGELPRAYFFDAKHRSVVHTGVSDAAWAKAWFEKEAKPGK
jgi:thiol-disulfide isomerase/thioredoxin